MRRTADERGFTLVEVLVTVSLVGLLMTGLASAWFTGWRTLDTAAAETQGSTDAGMLAFRFSRDVTAATDARTSGIGCGGTTDPQLELSDGATFRIVYDVRPTAGGAELVRHDCSSGTARNTVVVARGLPEDGDDAVEAARIPASGSFAGATLEIETGGAGGDVDSFTVTGRGRAS